MNRERWTQVIALIAIGVFVWITASTGDGRWHAASQVDAADSASGGGKGQPTPVMVVKPQRRDLRRIVRMTADVRPWYETKIKAQVAGYVKSPPLEVGTRVKKGGTLLEIGIPEVDAALTSADERIGGAGAAVTQAEAAAAEAREAVKQAEVGRLQAQVRAKKARGMIEAAKADVIKAQAKVKTTEGIYERLEAARERSPNLVSPEKVDIARGDYEVARAELRVAEIGIEAAKDNYEVARAGVTAAGAAIEAARLHIASAQAAAKAAHAKAALATAEKGEKKATQDLATITAPYDGLVAERMVEMGALVRDARRNSAAMPLYRFLDDARLRLRFFLSSPDAPMVRVDNKVHVTFDEFPDWKPIEVQVSHIANALDPKTRTMEVEVALWNVIQRADGSLANLDSGGEYAKVTEPTKADKDSGTRLLRADTFARVTVQLEKHENALVVPIACVKTKKQKSWVMIVDDKNVVRKIGVEIGPSNGFVIELRGDSINESHQVISRGTSIVTDGESAAPQLETKEW